MRAILIDPFAEQITTVEHDGTARCRKLLIGTDAYRVVRVRGDDLFLDDEGEVQPKQRWFRIKGYPMPLAGRALVLGCDDEGESCAPRMREEQARRLVTFEPEGFAYDPPRLVTMY